jgi:hypothetical protein
MVGIYLATGGEFLLAAVSGWGEVIQIVLRLAGPLFFGLALLSLRGRVKR